MRQYFRSLAVLSAFAALGIACAKVPYTGRKQFNIIPDSMMRGLGKSVTEFKRGMNEITAPLPEEEEEKETSEPLVAEGDEADKADEPKPTEKNIG